MKATLYVGDAREVLASLTAESISAVVTDPPYELGFMGKAWDKRGIATDPTFWTEVQRVMKPGAHLLAFGGTRTYHRMTCAIEDAGFEIRDCLMWVYGSGFPKSKNLSGEWDGWGSALKPAVEPIVLARKPLSEASIAANVERWGTGALNVSGCRIATEDNLNGGAYAKNGTERHDGYHNWRFKREGDAGAYEQPTGRWPANLILDEFAAEELDRQSGDLGMSSGGEVRGEASPHGIFGSRQKLGRGQIGRGDTGGASRFFYVAKPDREERDAGLRHIATSTRNRVNPGGLENDPKWAPVQARNTHPTVKPVALMKYLVRLVTPPGGTVLDPFTGSGTTGMAAVAEGFDFIGIDQSPDYITIAEARIHNIAPLLITTEIRNQPL